MSLQRSRRRRLATLAWLLWWASAGASAALAGRLGLIWESQAHPRSVVLELAGERREGELSRAWDGAWRLQTRRGTLYPPATAVAPLLERPADRPLPWRPALLVCLALGGCCAAYVAVTRLHGRSADLKPLRAPSGGLQDRKQS